MKKLKIRSIQRKKEAKRPLMSRQKMLMEWYANGYDPNRESQNQNFEKAVKQTAPVFDVGRLDSGDCTVMNGINALVTSPLPGMKSMYAAEISTVKSNLIDNWRIILSGKNNDFHVVGVKVGSSEVDVWVFHDEVQTLFILHFTSKSDNWLEKPVYHFE